MPQHTPPSALAPSPSPAQHHHGDPHTAQAAATEHQPPIRTGRSLPQEYTTIHQMWGGGGVGGGTHVWWPQHGWPEVYRSGHSTLISVSGTALLFGGVGFCSSYDLWRDVWVPILRKPRGKRILLPEVQRVVVDHGCGCLDPRRCGYP